MIKNLIFIIIVICVTILLTQMNQKEDDSNIIEKFIDNNFVIDKNQMSEEKSIRFSQNNKYNNDRTVYGFNNLDYFYNNRFNIFNFYGIKNKKILSYLENKYDLIKKTPQKNMERNVDLFPINNNESYEIGIGLDNRNSVNKIYFLINNVIHSLKVKNKNEIIESIYKDDSLVNENELKNYLGEKNFNIIDENIRNLKILEFSNFNQYLENMVKFSNKLNRNFDISSTRNIFERDLQTKYKETPKNINSLRCFVRYDNNKLAGYNYDISEKKLYIKNSKPFLEKLLKQLNCNISDIDKWINEYGNYLITFISFIYVNNELNVTIYYYNENP